MSRLKEKVALVTGASRGIGRGIAHELGLAGATVYVTGRSREGGKTTEDMPETIDETARLVTDAGGVGIAVECDHTDPEATAGLAALIKNEHGRLNLLVNNIWGGYEQYDQEVFGLPVWEQPVWRWDKMFAAGVRAHYLTSRAIIPLMIDTKDALIVNISAGDDGKFLGDIQYDVAKNAIDRLGFALARKLKQHGITALTVHPGFTRTERVKQAFGENPLPPNTHSARFVGRAVVALAADERISGRTGGVFKAGQLGLDYGFTDTDGSQPEPFCLPEGYGE